MSLLQTFAAYRPTGPSRTLAVALAIVAILCAARVACCVLSPSVLGSTTNFFNNMKMLLIALPFFALAGYYCEIRKDITATLTLLVPVFFVLGGVASLELQYIIFHAGRGFRLIDADLAAWDAALGFDWTAYFDWVVSHAGIHWVIAAAYQSIWWQPLALIAIFTVRKRLLDYATLQIALPLSFQITCIVAMVLPALGAYQFHGMTPDRHPGISLEFTDGMTAPIMWLRQAELPSVMPIFRDLRVITFPSFHAASAVIFILSAWPLRRLRWVGLVLNGLMLAATPVQGSHYVSDIIVGAGIGGAAFVLAAWVLTVRPLARFAARPGRSPRAAEAHPTA